jgi:hypothetical protein
MAGDGRSRSGRDDSHRSSRSSRESSRSHNFDSHSAQHERAPQRSSRDGIRTPYTPKTSGVEQPWASTSTAGGYYNPYAYTGAQTGESSQMGQSPYTTAAYGSGPSTSARTPSSASQSTSWEDAANQARNLRMDFETSQWDARLPSILEDSTRGRAAVAQGERQKRANAGIGWLPDDSPYASVSPVPPYTRPPSYSDGSPPQYRSRDGSPARRQGPNGSGSRGVSRDSRESRDERRDRREEGRGQRR